LALGDAVRIGEGKQQTNLIEAVLPIRTSRSWKLSLPEVGGASHSLAGGTVDGRIGSVIVLSMQGIQAESQIGVTPAGVTSQNISFTEQGGEFTGKARVLQGHSLEQHVRETWMQRQLGHLSSMSGDLSLCIECAEAGE
jgi:hypothetical protein